MRWFKLIALSGWLLGVVAGCSNALNFDALDTEAEDPCAPSEARCGGVCVEILTDPQRCGGCSPCVAGPGAQVVACRDGACAFGCEPGQVDVNGDVDQGADGDGCECVPRGEVCNGQDDDCDGLVDEELSNVCGGCAELTGAPGQPCGDPDCGGGQLDCAGPDRLLCFGDNVNLCGGCEVDLQGTPGDPCGQCATLECDDTLALVCVSQERVFFQDLDGDNVGDAEASQIACEPEPPFTALQGGDCDDQASTVYPGAPEICDNLDNNCDELADEADEALETSPCALTQGVCAGSRVGCREGVERECTPERYGKFAASQGHSFETPFEVRCDGQDNDCNGDADEHCCQEAVLLEVAAPLTEGDRQVTPSLALSPDGRRALVTWLETDSRQIQQPPPPDSSLVGMAGLELDGVAFYEPELFGLSRPGTPRVSVGPEGFEAVVLEGDEVRWRRLDADGQEVVAAALGSGDSPMLAPGPDGEVAVAWRRASDLGFEVILRKVSPQGTFGDAMAIFNQTRLRNPQLLFDPLGVALTFETGDANIEACLATFSADLRRRSLGCTATEASAPRPVVSADGQGYVVAFVARDAQTAREQIHLLRTDAVGASSDMAFVATQGDVAVRDPALVRFPDGFGLLWVEGSGPNALRFARFNPDEGVVGQPVTLIDNVFLHHRPYAVVTIPGAGELSPPFMAVAVSVADGNSPAANPERLKLTFFDSRGAPLCF